MSVILHISDTHFGTERPQVAAALTNLSRAQRPDLLIFSGDITQRARPGQFAAARRFVAQLDIAQVLAIPGNHDIPLFALATRMFAPYRRYRRAFGEELEPEFSSRDLLVLGVRTARRYRHVQGEVSRAQVRRVAARLRAATAQQLRVVVTHQPVQVTRTEDEKNLLRRHGEAVASWLDAGVDLILGGHIHLPSVAPLGDSGAWAVQAGTALSSRIRFEANNSVNLIRYQGTTPQHCLVERWDFDDDAGDFVLVGVHDLHRSCTASVGAIHELPLRFAGEPRFR
ncbi:MAG: metallophosphoesterase family protein [Porticoccaceae bacterium]